MGIELSCFGGLYVRALARPFKFKKWITVQQELAYLGLGATGLWGFDLIGSSASSECGYIPKTLCLRSPEWIPFRETIFLPQSLIMLSI